MRDGKDAMPFPEKCVSQFGMRCYEGTNLTDHTESSCQDTDLSLHILYKGKWVPVHSFVCYLYIPPPLHLFVPNFE
jgi:hypothetical protein